MRAYVLKAENQAEFAEVDTPQPGPDEVLVRVRASSVNPHDLHVLTGAARAYLEYDLPATLGTDVAGDVEAVGDDVDRVSVGDRVFGLQRSLLVHRGTFGEYVVLPEGSLTKTPDTIDDVHAGALGLASVTALTAIEAADIKPGSTVLINGATGGVGSFAIQFARLAGAQVVATSRAGSAADYVCALGATQAVDWTTEDLASVGRVDVLLDFVTFDAVTLDELVNRVLAEGGRAFTTLAPTSSTAQMLMAAGSPEMLDRIAGHVARGDLNIPVHQQFSFDELEKALAALGDRKLGKIGVIV